MYAYHEGNDSVGEELVDKVGVELDSLGVYGIVTTAQWDDAGPRDGEPVSLHAILVQQGDVILPTLVRIGGDVSILAIESLARRPGKVVPDRFATAVDVSRALNLEGSYGCRNTVGWSAAGSRMSQREWCCDRPVAKPQRKSFGRDLVAGIIARG